MPKEIALGVFRSIRDAFPHLEMELSETLDHEWMQAELEIAQQCGLPFRVNLNVQGDELHLNAGALWVEWFPCTNPKVVARYVAAVCGLLDGRSRIVEHIRGGDTVKAVLQESRAGGWLRVATWAKFHVPWPWRKTYRILRVQTGSRDLPAV